MSVLPTTVPSKTLAQNLSSSGTTLYLSNTLSWDGVQLTSADFGTQLFAVLRNPSNTQLELIELDPATIDSTSTITILKRGLPYSGGQTANTETKYDWSGSTTICELGSDTPQLLAQLVEEAGAETIAGVKTFSSIPKTTGGNASDDNELVRYAQALSLLTSGTYSQNRVVLAGTAGETLAAGNLVYLKIADGRWWKCDADTAATVENIILGIAQGAGTAGNAVTSGVLLFGLDSNQTGLTANTKYYASNTAGGLSSSAGTVEVSIGFTLSTTTIVFWPRYDQQITEDIQDALTPGSNYGTPSASNPYLTKAVAATTEIPVPIIRTYTANDTWTKPAGLKYVIAEVVGGGGGGGGGTNQNESGGGGGGGGYSREVIPVASLGATEAVTVGAAGAAGASTGGAGGNGGTSSFGTVAFLQATGGTGGDTGGNSAQGGAGGVGSNGTLNIEGEDGGGGGGGEIAGTSYFQISGKGGNSYYGGGGKAVVTRSTDSKAGIAGNNYGGGGSGMAMSNASADTAGGAGAAGVVVITEFYI